MYRDLDDFESFSNHPRQNVENYFLEPLTHLSFDNESFKVLFDQKDLKLKLIKETSNQAIAQTTVKFMTSLNQCQALTDSKFVCSTGALLQLFDARNLTQDSQKRQACQYYTSKVDKLLYVGRLNNKDIVAYTCEENPHVINFLDFNPANSIYTLLDSIDPNAKKVIIDDIKSQLPQSLYNFELDVKNSIVKYKDLYYDHDRVFSIYSVEFIDKAFKVTFFRAGSEEKIVLEQQKIVFQRGYYEKSINFNKKLLSFTVV